MTAHLELSKDAGAIRQAPEEHLHPGGGYMY